MRVSPGRQVAMKTQRLARAPEPTRASAERALKTSAASSAAMTSMRSHTDGYTVDVDALRTLAHERRPRLITLGGSLNLFPHPVAAVRGIADEVGALLMFDAAHLQKRAWWPAAPGPTRSPKARRW